MAKGPVLEVRVWDGCDGGCTAVMADGSEGTVCEADAECSAFMVSDVEDSEALLAAANTALEQAGFSTSEVDTARRRLESHDYRRRLAFGVKGGGAQTPQVVEIKYVAGGKLADYTEEKKQKLEEN